MLDRRTFKQCFIEINLSVKSQNVLCNFSNRVCMSCIAYRTVDCSSGYLTLW